MGQSPIVFVVDDDPSMRGAVVRLLRSVDLPAKAFGSAEDFLTEPRPQGPACLVLDVRLSRSSGFDVQREMAERKMDLPIIFLTAYGTIPMTVKAMKAGAVEFLTKPFVEEEFLDAVRHALARDEAGRRQRADQASLEARYETLTAKERRVMELVMSGLLNKQAADILGVSEITVKVHRRHVMEKMQAGSGAELARMAERLEAMSSPASALHTKV